MLNSSAVCQEGDSDPTAEYENSFRSLPWFILRDTRYKSKEAAFILSVLWCHSSVFHEAGPPGVLAGRSRAGIPAKITNEKIARLACIKGGAEEVRRQLAILERQKVIERQGAGRNRVVWLLFDVPGDCRGLTIDGDLLFSGLSHTKKLLAAIKRHFPKMSKDEICRRLNITEIRYWQIINKIEPPEKTKSNPPKKLSEPPEKTKTILGVVGGDLGLAIDKATPYKGIASPEKDFPQDIPMKEGSTVPFDYSIYTHKKKIAPIKKDEPISQEILTELQEEVFQHRHIAKAVKNTTMAAAAKVVRALKRPGGLSTIMDEAQIEQVAKCMSEGFAKLDPDAVRQVLHKQFSEEERIELYERLSNSMSEAYLGGSGKNIGLADAACMNWGAPGFSRLVLVWLRPPQLKSTKPPTPKIPVELECIVGPMMAKMPAGTNRRAAIAVARELKAWHDNSLVPFMALVNSTDSRDVHWWLNDFLNFAYNKTTNLHPAALRPTGELFQKWEQEHKREVRRKAEIARTIKQNEEGRARREAEEHEVEFAEAHGLMDKYGDDIVWRQ